MDILERVARAQCRRVEELSRTPGEPPGWSLLGYPTLDAFIDAAWPNYVEQVRAGLEALREAPRSKQPTVDLEERFGASGSQ